MGEKHYHPQYEIYYLISGDRNYFIQDRAYNIQRGDLILVNSNALHKTVDGFSDSHERILIEFDMSFFEDFLVNCAEPQLLNAFNCDSNILRLDEHEKKQIENCLFKIIQESKEDKTENTIALKVYLLELLIIVNKLSTKENAIEFDHPSELHKKISEIIRYINLNYMHDMGLDISFMTVK